MIRRVRLQLRANRFEVFLAILALWTVLNYIAHPDPLEVLWGDWDWIWRVCYLGAAVLTMVGVLSGHLDLEVAGLVLLAGGAAVNLIAIVSTGLAGIDLVLQPPLPLIAVWFCSGRAIDALRGRRVMVIAPEHQ